MKNYSCLIESSFTPIAVTEFSLCLCKLLFILKSFKFINAYTKEIFR
ncbi:MAG: hypothetical protein QOH49_4862 [Acidobacteriota bacterium]|jgi:hypothetical protein|nr:hypothetical protein [Acidobacteriota bacterium]